MAMYSSHTITQIPARCLFPDSTPTPKTDTPQVKPSVAFSIGDIMKSVGLPVQEPVHTPNTPVVTQTDVPAASTVQRPQGLQLEDLLHNQPQLPKSHSETHSRNPFLSFLDTPSVQDANGRCRTPPLTVPLSLQHLQSWPELSPGLPPTFQALASPTTQSACPVPPPSSDVNLMPRAKRPSEKSLSPTSDISEDLIDVESVSPGSSSTTSSGFCSNSSSTTSPTTPSPTDTTDVPANNRTAYSEKQSSRLKQVFQQTRYPDVEQYEELSEELNIPIQRLRVWFQNRRARSKRSVPDTRMMNYPPQMAAMMPTAPGYGYMAPNPIMHQSMYQYPVSPAPMYPMYPPNMYPGYSYPFQYQH